MSKFFEALLGRIQAEGYQLRPYMAPPFMCLPGPTGFVVLTGEQKQFTRELLRYIRALVGDRVWFTGDCTPHWEAYNELMYPRTLKDGVFIWDHPSYDQINPHLN